MSRPPSDFRELKTQERREKVVETVRSVLNKLQKKKRGQLLFASGARVPRVQLRESADDRWDLSGGPKADEFPRDWFKAIELLEMRQGVTPGGCLDVFLMDKNKAELLQLEGQLIHKAIKSKQLARWRVEWKNQVLFYPYHIKGTKAQPAFTILWDEILTEKLKNRLLQLEFEDALDFDKQIDDRELEIVRESGINNESAREILRHRVGLGLVAYPNAAAYLVENYMRLHNRVFEKRKFTDLGKRWYEYHRPRAPELMLAKPRILTPTLVREVRFVVDESGYLSDHACLMIQPTKKTARAWEELEKKMQTAMGRNPTMKDLLQYCIAFLNANYSQDRLLKGHRPTPKGSYAITEAFLREIPIPAPTDARITTTIIKLVDELDRKAYALAKPDEVEEMEARLQVFVDKALAIEST